MAETKQPMPAPPKPPTCGQMCASDGTRCQREAQHAGPHKCARGGEWL